MNLKEEFKVLADHERNNTLFEYVKNKYPDYVYKGKVEKFSLIEYLKRILKDE